MNRCGRTVGDEEFGPYTCGGELEEVVWRREDGKNVVEKVCKRCKHVVSLEPFVVREAVIHEMPNRIM